LPASSTAGSDARRNPRYVIGLHSGASETGVSNNVWSRIDQFRCRICRNASFSDRRRSRPCDASGRDRGRSNVGRPEPSRAMVSSSDAEPVRAARISVAAAGETSGPPSMPSTHAFAASKASSDVTTAPKPTEFATLMIRHTLDPALALRLQWWETISRRHLVRKAFVRPWWLQKEATALPTPARFRSRGPQMFDSPTIAS
jgi:hypothetical protein